MNNDEVICFHGSLILSGTISVCVYIYIYINYTKKDMYIIIILLKCLLQIKSTNKSEYAFTLKYFN